MFKRYCFENVLENNMNFGASFLTAGTVQSRSKTTLYKTTLPVRPHFRKSRLKCIVRYTLKLSL